MVSFLAAAVIFITVAAALSLFLYLPALAVAESLSPRRPSERAAIWVAALVLPIFGGLTGSLSALNSAFYDPYGSPHVVADRPHLCSRWLLEMPDAQWLLRLVGAVAIVLLVLALARVLLRGIRSMAAVRPFLADPAVAGGVMRVGTPSVFVGTVGVLRPVTLVTSGAEELISARELMAVLAHESQHARRFDNLWDLVAQTCVTAIAFVPTAYLFHRYWRDEAERACDDAAAKVTSPREVASAMVSLAQAGVRKAEDRLLQTGGSAWRHAEREVVQRGRRLLDSEKSDESGSGSDMTVAGILVGLGALLAVGLGIAATAGQVQDTLRCMADTLLEVIK